MQYDVAVTFISKQDRPSRHKTQPPMFSVSTVHFQKSQKFQNFFKMFLLSFNVTK